MHTINRNKISDRLLYQTTVIYDSYRAIMSQSDQFTTQDAESSLTYQ
jgi:hypothetical protein